MASRVAISARQAAPQAARREWRAPVNHHIRSAAMPIRLSADLREPRRRSALAGAYRYSSRLLVPCRAQEAIEGRGRSASLPRVVASTLRTWSSVIIRSPVTLTVARNTRPVRA